MTRAVLPSGIELEYDTFGSTVDPPLLLVMGLGAQMILWDDTFCNRLVSRGRYVIRFDNRDVGLSSKVDGRSVDVMAVVAAATAGAEMPDVPYTLSDMAADAIGLLDHLEIDRAHVAGASMGGMIVQTMAIEHPERLLSVTSIMSTIGDPEFGGASDEALGALLVPPATTRDEAIEQAAVYRAFASNRFFDLDKARERAAAQFDRCFYPEGFSRQLGAIFASGDRSDGLRSEVADMGHDMPEQLWPLLIGSIVDHGDMAMSLLAETVAS